MNFKIAPFTFLFILASFIHAGAQGSAKCSLTPVQLSQAAELRGLWPGMTAEQVKTLVPAIEMGTSDELGLSKTSFSPDFNPKIDKTVWAGIRTVSLDFLDGRLFSLWIGYNDSYKLKTVDEVSRALTQSLKLVGEWETKSRGQQFVCGDYQLVVTMVAGSPTLRITDERARETWEKRRAEKEAEEP